jgi:hypothetical protein
MSPTCFLQPQTKNLGLFRFKKNTPHPDNIFVLKLPL